MTAYDDWGYPTSTRNHFREPLSLTARATTLAKSGLEQAGIYNPRAPASRRWNFRRILSLPNFLILLWIFYIRWGERTVFSNAIQACDWDSWESWVCRVYAQPACQQHAKVQADLLCSLKMPLRIISSSSLTSSSWTPTPILAGRGRCPP